MPWPVGAILFLIPIAAGMAAYASVAKWVRDEPFGIFRSGDIEVFIAYATVAIGSTVVWILLARRWRLDGCLIAAVLLWLACCVLVTVSHAVNYFGEPWNP